MTTCGRCGSEMPPGPGRCEVCGYAPSAPPLPPGPDDRYPRRSYAVKLGELVGWSDERVLSILGEPDEKSGGSAWNSPELFDPPTILTSSGEVMKAHRFGPALPRIPTFTPYQTWQYHNVDHSEWLLYLTKPDAPTEAPSSESGQSPPRKGIWTFLRDIISGGRGSPSTPSARHALRLRGPLVVADVTSYPTGAVF